MSDFVFFFWSEWHVLVWPTLVVDPMYFTEHQTSKSKQVKCSQWAVSMRKCFCKTFSVMEDCQQYWLSIYSVYYTGLHCLAHSKTFVCFLVKSFLCKNQCLLQKKSLCFDQPDISCARSYSHILLDEVQWKKSNFKIPILPTHHFSGIMKCMPIS